MQIALFQPDIPQNTGTILRLCACLDVAAHIIEPAGFPVSDRHFRRAGMDYLDQVSITRHDSWSKFEQWRREAGHRLVLFTTKGADSYLDYRYEPADILLFGRESAGVTDEVVAAADARLVIPIKPGLRSLNVAMAAAMALGEALRQTGLHGLKRGELVSYAVKEIFLTLQGEGAHAGRAAVFCRFAGCNLWSGREQDRARATCQFCDTDFVGTDGTLGGRFAVGRGTRRHHRRAMDRRQRQPLCGADRRRAAAAGRCRPGRRAACARLCGRRRDQRHDRAARRHGLDLRQPESRRRARGPARP